jgi:hypothetical protein
MGDGGGGWNAPTRGIAAYMLSHHDMHIGRLKKGNKKKCIVKVK